MISQHDAKPDHDGRRARPLLRTTLGDVLRRTRLEQGRTLADVAHAAKVSMQYLSEVERGRKEASSEVLAAICEALETDLPDVLAEVGRELAGAQRAPFIRLNTGATLGGSPDRTGLDWRAASRQPAPGGAADIVGLLAA